MTRVPLTGSFRRCHLLILSLLAFVACTDKAPPSAPLSPPIALAVGGSQGPTVKSTSPDSARVDTTLDVRVLGSGFDAGSRADWAFKGVVSEKIVTNSTRFVSSRELVANITITRDANLGKHDVIVTTSSGKGGIGTEIFEVTLLIVDLGSPTSALGADDAGSVASAVNKWGVSVGFAATRKYEPGSYFHAMRWTIDAAGKVQMEDLMPRLGLAVTADAFARGINDAGVIVGDFRASDNDTSHAFVLEPSGMTDLHGLPSCSGAPLDANYSSAADINNRGEIVGVRQLIGAPYRAFFLSLTDRCIAELPSLGGYSEARSINDSSVITGRSSGQAVVWTKSSSGVWTIRSLGPEGADAWGINVRGEVAGIQFVPNGDNPPNQLAFAWLGDGAGTPTNVGTLGGLASAAYGISESGMIVGWAHNKAQIYHPFLWTPAGMRDLGTLGGQFGSANAIDGQWVVGNTQIRTAKGSVTGHATLWKVP